MVLVKNTFKVCDYKFVNAVTAIPGPCIAGPYISHFTLKVGACIVIVLVDILRAPARISITSVSCWTLNFKS